MRVRHRRRSHRTCGGCNRGRRSDKPDNGSSGNGGGYSANGGHRVAATFRIGSLLLRPWRPAARDIRRRRRMSPARTRRRWEVRDSLVRVTAAHCGRRCGRGPGMGQRPGRGVTGARHGEQHDAPCRSGADCAAGNHGVANDTLTTPSPHNARPPPLPCPADDHPGRPTPAPTGSVPSTDPAPAASTATPHPAPSARATATHPVAVGTALAGGPPHRSQRAGLPHWAPTSGAGVEAHAGPGMRDADGW